MKPQPLQEKYGSWTVLDPSLPYRAHDLVRVLCECGNLREVRKTALTREKNPSRSCGCKPVERLRASSWPEEEIRRDPVVVPGARFGRWTALTIPHHEPGRRDRVALCRCTCGTEKLVVAYDLTRADNPSTSCGCRSREALRAMRRSSSAN